MVDGAVRKNSSEIIRVRSVTYKGVELLDARVYADTLTGDAVPTKKGLTLRPATWRELLPRIAATLEGMPDDNGAEN